MDLVRDRLLLQLRYWRLEKGVAKQSWGVLFGVLFMFMNELLEMPVWAGLFFCLGWSFLGWNGSSWPKTVPWLRLSAALCLIFDVDYLSGILPEYFIKILLRLCKALFDFCIEHLEKLLSCALAGWITLSILRSGRKSACSLQDIGRGWLCCL